MSAGAFQRSKYEADDGTIYNVRVQPETIAAQFGAVFNQPPAGAVTGKVSAKVSGGNREYGVKCRAVTCRFNGILPDGYKADEILRIAVLQKGVYDTVNPGSTGTYLDVGIEVVGKLPERIR